MRSSRTLLLAWLLVATSMVMFVAPFATSVAEAAKNKAARKKESAKKKTSKKKTSKKKTSKKKKKNRRFRGCPKDMVNVRNTFCVDRYEAYTAIMLPRGRLRRHSPFKPVGNKKVKALNRKGRMPQAYINRNQAERACKNAKKRLCSDDEWVLACKGKRPTIYPYGKKHKPGRCNDTGISSFNLFFGGEDHDAPQSAYTWDNLNDPRLNKPKGTAAPAGRFKKCRNSFRVYDMVDNLHEWTASRSGTFRGGYYLDVHENGTGCEYKTTAHSPKYHDYSTGFRCCK